MTSFERRRHARAALQARAVLSNGPTQLGTFDVINLALGGVLLAGPAPVAIGTRIELALVLDEPAGATAAAPLSMTGRVLRERTTNEGPGFVLVLDQLAPAQAIGIGARIEASLVEARNAHVLVVDQTRAARWQLRTQLAGMGHTSCAVATPLEAVHALGESNRFEVAMVALTARDQAPRPERSKTSHSDALDLMAHLADQHPYLRRIILSDPLQGHLGPALRHRPQAAPHEVLARPCNEAALARAVAG